MTVPAAVQRDGSPAAVLAAVLLATAPAPLNATMIVVALPALLADLHGNALAGSLLVTGYLLPMAVLPPLGGALGDRLGRRRLLLAGLGVLAAGALGAASAPGLGAVLTFRVLQAAGAALAFPNALALLSERLPARNRGLGFGLVGTTMALAAAIGPGLALLLLAIGGWRWVFAVNVPVLVAAAAMAAVAFERDHAGQRPGAGAEPRRGILPGLAAAALAIGLSNMALYAALVGVPLLMGAGASTSQSGLLVTAMLAAAALSAPGAGRMADLHGRRPAAVAGLGLLAAGMLPMALVGQRLGPQAMTVLLVVAGIGLGASSTAIQTGAIEAADRGRSGAAAGLLATGRYLGGAAGSSMLPLVLVLAPAEPLRALFAVAAAAAAMAAAAGLRVA
jgi:MFS family permease